MVALAIGRARAEVHQGQLDKQNGLWAQHRLPKVLFYSPLVAPVLLTFSFGHTDQQFGSTSFHMNQ